MSLTDRIEAASDLDLALNLTAGLLDDPIIEWDDGTYRLYWYGEGTTFALTMSGDGTAIATRVPLIDGLPCKISLTDAELLRRVVTKANPANPETPHDAIR